MTENTTDQTQRPRWGRILILAAAAAAVIIALVIALLQLTGGRDGDAATPSTPSPSATTAPTPSPTGAPTDTPTTEGDDVPGTITSTGPQLPEPLNGQAAIDALGDDIAIVAKRSGKTVEELTDLLLRDSTAHISTTGYLVYLDDLSGGNGTRP